MSSERYKNQLKQYSKHNNRYKSQLKQYYSNRYGSQGAASPVKYINPKDYLLEDRQDKLLLPESQRAKLETSRKSLERWADTILKNHRRN